MDDKLRISASLLADLAVVVTNMKILLLTSCNTGNTSLPNLFLEVIERGRNFESRLPASIYDPLLHEELFC